MKYIFLTIGLIISTNSFSQTNSKFSLSTGGGFASGPSGVGGSRVIFGHTMVIGVDYRIAEKLLLSLNTELFAVMHDGFSGYSEARKTNSIQALVHLQTNPKRSFYLDLGLGVQEKFHKWILNTDAYNSILLQRKEGNILIPTSTLFGIRESSFGYTIQPGIYKTLSDKVKLGIYAQFQNDDRKYSVYILRLAAVVKL